MSLESVLTLLGNKKVGLKSTIYLTRTSKWGGKTDTTELGLLNEIT